MIITMQSALRISPEGASTVAASEYTAVAIAFGWIVLALTFRCCLVAYMRYTWRKDGIEVNR